MQLSRDDLADIACAAEEIPFVAGVHELPPRDDPDAYAVVVALVPYGIDEIIRVHYALVEATEGRELAGRVLYVDGTRSRIAADPVILGARDRGLARTRIEARRKPARSPSLARERFEAALREILDTPTVEAVGITFGKTPVLEIVKDPFPSAPRRRVLVVDDDPITAIRVGKLDDVDVIQVDDAWSAVDRLTKGDIDLAICALSIGGVSGAKIHKLVAAERPEVVRRIVFLASEAAVSQAPPSSASGRVVARPITPETVRSLLDVLGSDGRGDRRG